ncbi:COR domain-containing protein [Actinocrispum sp. NPDC049592]|uniref:leucine-rich repeat domain-containing protein n=1 Tax=Actinocrispum sp. NPDC049592 TaxID=3154835 RepID=UPI00342F4E91
MTPRDEAHRRIDEALATGADSLDLSGLRLGHVPRRVAMLTGLKELYLADNGLSGLPDWIGGFADLSVLSLHGNAMVQDPKQLRRLTGLTVLELPDSSTHGLPDWLSSLRRLRRLTVGSRELTELPDWLADLDLAEFGARDNSLSALPEWFGRLPLTSLDLRSNNLRGFPDVILRIRSLKTLRLSRNPLKSIPASIEDLTALECLQLAAAGLRELPDSLVNLPALTELSVDGNGLNGLPDWLWTMTRLTTLAVADCHLTKLPEQLAEFRQITTLHLNRNRIHELPEWFSSLVSLRTLNIAYCSVRTIPERLGQLRDLRFLDLTANRLRSVPSSLGELRELTTLLVSRNQLLELPETIGGLVNLARLDISDNLIEALPASLTRLSNLTILNAQRNRLDQLPDDIGSLRDLRSLYAGHNRLTALPESLGELHNLFNLNVENNDIESLPDTTPNLTELSYLRISKNRIRSFPDGMARLTQLAELELFHNGLTDLPDWIANLRRLRRLTVGGNPLESPPPEIVAAGVPSILAFLRARRDGATQLWQSKLLVVGEGGVGKTSLVKALSGLPHDPAEQSTHGMRVHDLDVPHPQLGHVQMNLSAWDFGGQQIYHATHQFFLTNRSLFVLLWNSRLGWEQGRLRYWLDIIGARAPESPIILVATHLGDRPADLPLDDLRREYPRIVASFAVDNATREGVPALYDRVAWEAAGLPLMGVEWPTVWLHAVDALLSSGHKHVTPEQMRQVVAKAGVPDRAQQDYLAVALHELGQILYYRDDPELSQTVVLRPTWVNEYISKVLDSHDVADRHGLLGRRHLNELWADLDRGLHEHFLGMMDKYDLSYRIDHAGDVSLVVERLPWNAPEYQAEWDSFPGQQIRVIYRLNTMPPGIPTWFIARSHRFSTNTHWRTGAVLEHQGRKALVRADAHRKTVELTVKGTQPAAFFNLLDEGLNRTLERYPGLRIERQVPCSCTPDCTHRYDYEDLNRRINRTPPKYTIECPKSYADVDVRSLLFGLVPSQPDQIVRMLEEVGDRLAQQAEYHQLMFMRLQHLLQRQQETRCPSVFALVPVHNKIASTGYELRLYCEEPGAWHRLPEPQGVYEIKQPKKWFRTAGPYLTGLIKVMQYAAPLVKPVLGITVDQLSEQLKSDCDLMKELIAKLPGELDDDDALEGLGKRAETEADFRVLEGMLTELDPQRGWGGLSRTTTPEGLTLYLCPQHLRAY